MTYCIYTVSWSSEMVTVKLIHLETQMFLSTHLTMLSFLCNNKFTSSRHLDFSSTNDFRFISGLVWLGALIFSSIQPRWHRLNLLSCIYTLEPKPLRKLVTCTHSRVISLQVKKSGGVPDTLLWFLFLIHMPLEKGACILIHRTQFLPLPFWETLTFPCKTTETILCSFRQSEKIVFCYCYNLAFTVSNFCPHHTLLVSL